MESLVLLSLLAIFLYCCGTSAAGETELIQVLVVTRHGHRNPKELYPSDPWRKKSYWPGGAMQLTPIGERQMEALGNVLKTRYEDFLPTQYDESNTLARSTNTSRTISSARHLLSTLYPNQSLPIFVPPSESDDLFNKYKRCPRYDEEMARVKNSSEYRKDEESRRNFYVYLTLHLGKRVSTLTQMERVYTNFAIEKVRGYRLPSWTSTVFPNPLIDLAGKSMAKGATTELSSRLRFGPLFKDILQHVKESSINGTWYKMLLYSAHDLTLAGMLSTLRVFDGRAPGFAAALVMEVHWNRTSSEKVVKLLYRKAYNAEFEEMITPSCGHYCTAERMFEILNPVIPFDIDEECSVRRLNSQIGMNITISTFLIAAACLGSFALGALVIIVTTKTIITFTSQASTVRRRDYIQI